MSPSTFSLIYVLVGYFGMFAVWLICALREKKGEKLISYRSTAIIQSSLNSLHILTGLFMPLTIGPDIIYRSFGLTIFTVGLFTAIWARISMGKSWDTPGTILNSSDHKLVTTGPFAYSRNPIYVGIILISLGIAISLKSMTFILVIFLYLHLYVKTREEEEKLQKKFGDAYTKYQIEVPRFI